jgi:predicted ferric reductase
MKRKTIRLLIFAAYLLSPLLFAAVAFRNRSSTPIASFLGIVAYTWLVAGVIIASRPTFIEKYFSLDKLNKFHAVMAILSLSIGIIHKFWITAVWGEVYGFSTVYGDLAIVTFLAIAAFTILIMTNWFGKWKLMKSIKTVLKKLPFAHYDNMKILHNFNILAATFLAIHVLTMTFVVQGDILAGTVLGAYFAIAVSLYVNHKFLKPMRLKKNLYTITSVQPEKGNILNVAMKPDQGEVFPYNAGQFVFMRVKDKRYPFEEHPFSLISAPQNRKEIAVAIKAAGDYTNKIQDLEPGVKVTVEGPYGGLWRIQEELQNTEDSLVLFAGGVGITPLLGILEDIKHKQLPNKIVLVWSLKDQSEFGFAAQLQSYTETIPDFNLVPFFANESGFLDAGKIQAIFQNKDVHYEKAQYLLCGPRPFMEAIETALAEKGVPKNRIHFEAFAL